MNTIARRPSQPAGSRLTMTSRRAPHDVGRAQRTTPPAYRARRSTAITARSARRCCHRRDGETDEVIDARYVPVRTVLVVPVLVGVGDATKK